MGDVTVMGGGIFGLSIAWYCAEMGARVRVVEPAGVGAGSSGGIVGALAPHTPERWEPKKQFQFESLMLAEPFWAEIEEISGKPSGYGRIGRLQPIANPHALGLAIERIDQASTLWQGKAKWAVVDADSAGDWAPPTPTGKLVHDTLSARIDPLRAVQCLAAALVSRGVEIVTEARAQGAVIWATGYRGLLELSQAFGGEIGNGVKGQAALVAFHASPGAPQIYAQGVHIVPHDNATVAIGSTSERYFDDPVSVDGLLDDVIARANGVIPALAGAEVIGRWAGVRPRAITRAPLLGPWPGRAGHFIANGGFKIGFGVANRVGQVMAELALNGRDDIPEAFKFETALARV